MPAPTPHVDAPLVAIEKHDRLQLEVKLTYPAPDPLEDWRHYQVDLYFQLPVAIGISSGPGAVERFYGDMRVYTRLRTPEITLEELARVDGQGSPLVALTTMAQGGGDARPERWRRELSLEARLLPRMLRRAAQRALTDVHAAPDPGARDRRLQRILESATTITTRYRDISRSLLKGPLDARSRLCVEASDEYLSLQVELLATHAIALVDPSTPDGPRLREALVRLARAEADYRRDRDWPSCLPEAEDPAGEERFLERAGQLKRYILRVLYLRAQPTRSHERALDLIRGVAAALAMSWAVALQIFTFYAFDLRIDQGVGTSIVVAFGALAVLGYILKDRIKSWTAEVLTRELPRFLDDRRVILRWGTSLEPIGHLAERASFEHSSELGPELRERLREASRNPLQAESGDDLLHYRRQVRMMPRTASESFPRFMGTTDILRLNLTHWVRTLTAPRREILVLSRDGVPEPRKLGNRYAVPIVVRTECRAVGQPPRVWWSTYRLVLTQRGIVRVEAPPVDAAPPQALVGAYL